MSKNMCRITGILLMITSVFPILGGLYLGDAGLPAPVPPLCLFIGLTLLVVGTVFYKILRND